MPKKSSDVDLGYIDPATEARSCMRIAHANGGIEKMRGLISISPEQERILNRLAEAGELSQLIVFRALAYREQVLAEFDRLIIKRNRAEKNLGQRCEAMDNHPKENDMKFVSELDPLPCDGGDGGEQLSKHRHHFEDNARVTVCQGPHAGRSGKLQGENAHGGHLVRLDDGNLVEYLNAELEPENFGTYSRTVPSEIGAAMSRGAVTKAYADASDDPLPVEPLAKSRERIDPSKVAVGMKVRGHDGTVGTITKVRGASVSIDYPNGEGVSLISHLEAA